MQPTPATWGCTVVNNVASQNPKDNRASQINNTDPLYAVASITIQLFLNELILQDHTMVNGADQLY